MTRRRPRTSEKVIEQYEHRGAERVNNPPVGLVSPELNGAVAKKRYQYDSHLDPQLVWTGKAEGTSFEVDTVSLHVHERIEPKTIIEALRSKKTSQQIGLTSFFSSPGENPPYREAIDFYRHKHGWSNRLIAGDSLLVMNSLLEKEGMGGQIQMIYIDPPYGINYGSNFQPFVNKRDVKNGKDEDLTQEPETIKAFRDTWELDIHSYLTYLRDRLLLCQELLTESGSVFVQISDKNLHHVRELLDEVFGAKNFCAVIPFRKKTMPMGTTLLEQMYDFLLWYAKNKKQVNYHQLFLEKDVTGDPNWRFYDDAEGKRHQMTREQVNNHALLPKGARIFTLKSLEPSGRNDSGMFNFEFEGKEYPHPKNGWATDPDGMKRLQEAGRLQPAGTYLRYIFYFDDYPITALTSPWVDTSWSGFGEAKIFVVQTNSDVISRCILMTTSPGDLVLDPTCGSGTTAYSCEKWGRRWITCDTSRVALFLARQRLMTSTYPYFELAHKEMGVAGGFNYETVSHITLVSISKAAQLDPAIVKKLGDDIRKSLPHATSHESSRQLRTKIEEIIQRNVSPEVLYDKPRIAPDIVRVSGPFTLEAVPAPFVKPVDEIKSESEADQTIVRTGETLRQREWRSELVKTGIRGKGGQQIEFSRVETLSGTKWLHADAETKETEPKRVVVSFGPDHAPLEQKQVTLALEESSHLFPRPKIVVFASFQFDPEAAKDIDEANLSGVTLLKVQMNTDLLTEDLKKKRSSNESFWLIGQPDIEVKHLEDGRIQVEVKGFDYYNTRTGEIESGGPGRVAMWMLDTDYDFRSLYPRQVFFPMAAGDEGWSTLARNLKAEVDEELVQQYQGALSIPFKPGEAVAVKIIDDRGIESLKIIRM